jgi:Tfp pilus assembly protein FimT
MVKETQKAISHNRAGFSLLEVMSVAAISLIVTMTALPNFITGIGNMRLRSSMTSLAGVIQNCRMLAVKQNQTMSTHFAVSNYGGVIAYVKKATDANPLATSDSQVQLEEPVTQVTTPSGAGAPSTLDSLLGFTVQTTDPSFGPTGLPCAYSGGVCTTNKGFVYYFHDTRPAGQIGWGALSISPAGRLKKWFWSGSAWTN